MKITVSFLVERSGHTRQWISKMASQGIIPGAYRRLSGRWSFPDSPELRNWIACEARLKKVRMQRCLHRDEQAVQVLQTRRKAMWKRFGTPGAKYRKQMEELAEQIQVAKEAVNDCLDCWDIAKETGRSKRWVSNLAYQIPGVSMRKNKLVFQKSAELAEWIEREKRVRLWELQKPRSTRGYGTPQPDRLLSDARRFRLVANTMLRNHPPKFWPQVFREQFVQEICGLCLDLQSHIKTYGPVTKRMKLSRQQQQNGHFVNDHKSS